jgi:hypothetical protein
MSQRNQMTGWSARSLAAAAIGLALTGSVPAMAADLPLLASDCLDLETFLAQIRRLPDSMYVHRLLADLSVQPSGKATQASPLAQRQALDLFDHPELTTFGLAAAKSGTPYRHAFTAYQSDCSKVVTGDIFSAEAQSTTWEIVDHSAKHLTLKRLTAGGDVEISSNLSLVMRQFQAFAPGVFAVKSVYGLSTIHECGSGTPNETRLKETTAAIVTELYGIEATGKAPVIPAGETLAALRQAHPRVGAAAHRRGDFAQAFTAETNPVCRQVANAAAAAKMAAKPKVLP